MGKPPRSPLVGYNHNIGHLGRVFHVQTEDSGPATPRLFTHLFFGGTILASRKHEYDAAITEDKVRALMQGLHKSMIRDLLQAKLDEKLEAFFRGRGEPIGAVVPAGAVSTAPTEESGIPLAISPPPPSSTAAAGAPPAARADEVASGREATTFKRRNTRPIVSQSPPREAAARPRAAPAGSPADGAVVVERNVVVGGAAEAVAHPPRPRAAVPYVLAGETGAGPGHRAGARAAVPADRSPTPAAMSAPSAVAAGLAAEDGRAPGGDDEPGHPGQTSLDAPPPSERPRRREKSLDDAILQYLEQDPIKR